MASPYESLDLVGLDGHPLPPDAVAGKAVVFVNVASRCGYTPQYEGLQALWEETREQGVAVVGVPCNQFGAQEPGTADEIRAFCSTRYGVTFPLLAKQEVNGPGRSALYRWLVGSEAGGGADVRWNFEKFVVAPDGRVVARFPSSVEPRDPRLVTALAEALGA